MTRPLGETMGEIAYLDFVLRQMYANAQKSCSPIERMVNEACGLPRLQLKEAKRIIKRIEKLQKLL